MAAPILSVIVPFYNVEPFIGKCLESIIRQDFQDMEILLVDDRGSDGSRRIADEYAAKDSRIRIIEHPRNLGLSAARNSGIAQAAGEWITLVDSDDFIADDCFSSLYRLCVEHDADVASAQHVDFTDEADLSGNDAPESIITGSGKDAVTRLLYQNGDESTVWCRFYRRHLLEGVQFPDGVYYEDLATLWKIMLKAEKTVLSSRELYFYRQRQGSAVNSPINDKKTRSADQIINDFESGMSGTTLERAMRCRCCSLSFNLLMQMKSGDERSEFFEDYIRKNRREVLLDPDARRKTRLAILTSFLGFNFTRNCFRLIGK